MPLKAVELSHIPAKTFLFDIGRVLLDFDFESSLVKLIPSGVQNPSARIRCVLERKDALEAGSVAPEAFAIWALKKLQSDATLEQFYHAWRHIFTYNAPMWECVRQLAKRRYNLILISNINAIHCPWIFIHYPEFSLFEHRVLSFEVGMLKPDIAIYRYTIDRYRLNPVNTVYIDDHPENIDMGRSMGFECWQYDVHHHQSFEKWLTGGALNAQPASTLID